MITLEGPDGWLLTSESAAFHPIERVAVISDVHLGYEWSRAAGGDTLPAHTLADTLKRLEPILAGVKIERLIVAGDLVEKAGPCVRTAADLRTLRNWLSERGVVLVTIHGNHDPKRGPAWPLSIELAGWTITHGHLPIWGEKTMSGHLHPVIRSGGLTAPCFLVSPKRIVLPAFSPNAAGLNVLESRLPAGWIQEGLRCVAGAGGELLDFGTLADLIARPDV